MEHNTTQQETSEKKGIKALLTASAKNKYKLVKQKTKEVQVRLRIFLHGTHWTLREKSLPSLKAM